MTPSTRAPTESSADIGANVAASPVALDEGYLWPHADRLLPDRDRLAVLFGPPPADAWPSAAARPPARPAARPTASPPVPPTVPTPPVPTPVSSSRLDADGPGSESTARPVVAPRRRPRGAAAAVPRALGFTVVAGVLWLVLWATLPRLIGWRPTLIVGGSMAPSIERGDVVLVRPIGRGSLGVGAVVTFPDPNRGGRLVTHRVVALLADGQVQTRGDHNHDPDPQPVRRGAIQGRAVLRIPYVGRPVIWVIE